ncbi:MAG: SPOR domain-containing protein [Proteobacteria bacterium]|nr:SPOR domain-containing protein [Pseudomonadota bacterium]MBU4294295.1 SPOR domain-containing protein [Pseudomonadota bacterium]MCG2746108.1 SPOR domain-containing protein [Desulfobulbaceae bacterium]
MAVKRKKKRFFTFRIELGIFGMLGVGVVSFCIFLWMFLLGVWSGQTVLLPSKPGKGPDMLTRMAAELWQQGKATVQEGVVPPPDEQVDEAGPVKDASVSTEGQAEPSFFSLQVGSFRDKKKAQRDVLGWQAKGLDAFFLPPEEGADAFRVFVGRFEKLAEANEVAASLENEEDVRAYVTLLPASKLSAAPAEQ